MSTPKSREFWEGIEKAAAEPASWPDWKRAGINVSDVRSEPRIVPEDLNKLNEQFDNWDFLKPKDSCNLIAQLQEETDVITDDSIVDLRNQDGSLFALMSFRTYRAFKNS